jgi:hypothetical protein
MGMGMDLEIDPEMDPGMVGTKMYLKKKSPSELECLFKYLYRFRRIHTHIL